MILPRLSVVALLVSAAALHAEPNPADQARIQEVKSTLQSLKFQDG